MVLISVRVCKLLPVCNIFTLSSYLNCVREQNEKTSEGWTGVFAQTRMEIFLMEEARLVT